jgi:hypothetical protein
MKHPITSSIWKTVWALSAAVLLSGAQHQALAPNIRSIGIIAALGDTCMFERVPDRPFEWIAPPEASFLEISDWGIDSAVTNEIARSLGSHYRVQSVTVERQDFDTWTYDFLARDVRELPIQETPVDAYLLVLRDWQRDEIGGSNHQLGGLGLYRRDSRQGRSRFGVFASYRLVLVDPDNGRVIASRPAQLPDGRLPWILAGASVWPRTSNDLSQSQRNELRADFLGLINTSLSATLRRMGLGS